MGQVSRSEIKHGDTLATLRISITYRTVTGNARKFDELSRGHPLDPWGFLKSQIFDWMSPRVQRWVSYAYQARCSKKMQVWWSRMNPIHVVVCNCIFCSRRAIAESRERPMFVRSMIFPSIGMQHHHRLVYKHLRLIVLCRTDCLFQLCFKNFGFTRLPRAQYS